MKGKELILECKEHRVADEDNSCLNCKYFTECASFCRDMHNAEPNAMDYFLNIKEYGK